MAAASEIGAYLNEVYRAFNQGLDPLESKRQALSETGKQLEVDPRWVQCAMEGVLSTFTLAGGEKIEFDPYIAATELFEDIPEHPLT